MTFRILAAGAAAVLTMVAAAGSAEAQRGGRGDDGDSYYNDMMRNPRLIEPYAEQRRYRAYYGNEGWYDRQRAAGYRGQVRVRPYGFED